MQIGCENMPTSTEYEQTLKRKVFSKLEYEKTKVGNDATSFDYEQMLRRCQQFFSIFVRSELFLGKSDLEKCFLELEKCFPSLVESILVWVGANPGWFECSSAGVWVDRVRCCSDEGRELLIVGDNAVHCFHLQSKAACVKTAKS